MQLSPYCEQEGEYGLNIDVDVALWIDSLKFQGHTPPLREASGFVIVNSTLHDQFDHFKKDIDPECSIVEYIELLQFWIANQKLTTSPVLVSKYGKQYIKLHMDEVDNFIVWLTDTRDCYKQVGRDVFTNVSSHTHAYVM